MVELPEATLVAGQGIEGDRFYGYKQDYNGQVTFFSFEVYEEMCQLFPDVRHGPEVFRRNVIVSGVNLEQWIGQEFEIQGIRFFGASDCAPCYWMDQAFAPGAEAALQGRGGLRARILEGGVLRRTA